VSPSRRSDVVVVDTNVASFLFNRRPQLRLYEQDLRGARKAISWQTVAEMLHGAERGNWGRTERARLDRFLRDFAKVPVDIELALAWARTIVASSRQGRRLETADAWIAASAILRGATLVTHDPDFRDLAIAGLTVVCRA
jgi:predicted nucleic acid-binding protein